MTIAAGPLQIGFNVSHHLSVRSIALKVDDGCQQLEEFDRDSAAML